MTAEAAPPLRSRIALRPTRVLVAVAALPLVASFAAAFEPAVRAAVLAVDAAIILVCAIDAVLGWRAGRALRVRLSAPGIWSLARPTRLEAAIDHPGAIALEATLAPDLPDGLASDDVLHRRVRLEPGQRTALTWTCRAQRRGAFRLAGAHLALRSPLGLWRRLRLVEAELAVAVHPDLKQLNEYALLARAGRLDLIGVRTARQSGGDTEFDRLRNWASGDPLSRIDWKATARRDHLTARDYRTSQDQTVILMVDAGRMMAGESGERGRTLLDLAIDAALMLGWVAAHQGDRVGLIAYADGVRRWVPPERGGRQVARLVHALHDLHVERRESRHEEAFLHLDRRSRKRSLVVMLTSILDDADADLIERHCRRISGRHLPLCVLLRDRDLFDRVPAPEAVDGLIRRQDDAFYEAAAAAGLAHWRRGLIDRLAGHGCLTIDTDPGALTPDLISEYLRVKARHLL